jgi:hypothetical protein
VTQDKDDISFRVIDRRMFTEEGELRPGAKEQATREQQPAILAPPAAPAAPSAVPPVAKSDAAAPSSEAPARSPHFEMLLDLVANNAMMMLGAAPHPSTGQAVVDLESARIFIDMLDALREKTLGNLSPEEEQLLAEILGGIKYTYLEMSKASAKAQAKAAGPATIPRR